MDDPNVDLYKVKSKNVSAVHQLYSNVSKGLSLSSSYKITSKKRKAVHEFLINVDTVTLERLLKFDDD